MAVEVAHILTTTAFAPLLGCEGEAVVWRVEAVAAGVLLLVLPVEEGG
jgi:hypothetical protein